MNETELRIAKETEKIKKIYCMLTDKLIAYIEEDSEEANTEEIGLVVDMIKDLTEAKENAAKTIYYETVVEAMHADGEPRALDKRP